MASVKEIIEGFMYEHSKDLVDGDDGPELCPCIPCVCARAAGHTPQELVKPK